MPSQMQDLTLAQGMTTGKIFNPVAIGNEPFVILHIIKFIFIIFGKPRFSEIWAFWWPETMNIAQA